MPRSPSLDQDLKKSYHQSLSMNSERKAAPALLGTSQVQPSINIRNSLSQPRFNGFSVPSSQGSISHSLHNAKKSNDRSSLRSMNPPSRCDSAQMGTNQFHSLVLIGDSSSSQNRSIFESSLQNNKKSSNSLISPSMNSSSQRDSSHLGSTQIQRMALTGDSSSRLLEQSVHGSSDCLANCPDTNLHDPTSVFETDERSLSMNPLSHGDPAHLGSQQVHPLALTGESSS